MQGAEKKGILILFSVLFATIFLTAIHMVIAADVLGPDGPTDITNHSATRKASLDPYAVKALAGNVSKISITAETISQSYAAFYGNVSGTVVLDDSTGDTFYKWDNPDPEGEIYATTYSSTVDWTSGEVMCYNFSITSGGDTEYANFTSVQELMQIYGQAASDVDALNRTFNTSTSHTEFYVGDYHVAGTTGTDDWDLGTACPKMNLFNGTTEESMYNYWEEVVMWHDAGQGAGTGDGDQAIYVSLLMANNTNLGFNEEIMDFQMLLPDDGHRGNTSDTIYYFYVELE